MARGGKRDGAGRPAGAATKRTREMAEKAAEEGITPLDFMLKVLRDEAATMDNRMWAAEKAAPYVHAKLASVEVTGDPDKPVQTVTRIELVAPGHDDSSD
ncbi:hypothetical protein PH562_16685 [Rhizobium sp. CNPSo 4062]|uniref:hypothetical protein n=1 Tax=Rhizobium sp. CNPSo 4062 TaxID=3021410 RepID=UPI00254B96B2|nr:hypothetical protein [Rhizobium sp. CNPSo 4062]MDK4703889.1 hypothetical protein [Rhizobium sp. CNPSo 4062]